MSKSKPFDSVRSILKGAAVTYTTVVLFVCFVLTGVSENSAGISPMNFLLIFPFALCFSLANHLLRSEKLGGFPKFLLHFLLTIGGFFVFLYLPAFPGGKSSSSVLVLFIVTIVYLILYGTVLLLRKRWKKEFGTETTYTAQFSSKSGSGKGRS